MVKNDISCSDSTPRREHTPFYPNLNAALEVEISLIKHGFFRLLELVSRVDVERNISTPARQANDVTLLTTLFKIGYYTPTPRNSYGSLPRRYDYFSLP